MIHKKHQLMIYMTSFVILIMLIVNFLGRYLHLFDHTHGLQHSVTSSQIEADYSYILTILLIIPIILIIYSTYLYKKDNENNKISFLLTLALTFGSIAIISGGSGRVEFHFSIFMVVAALGYYQNIKLITLMTTLFTIQHLIGFFYLPEIVFGVHDYSFSMLLMHAAFLVFTSSAVALQVYSSKRIEHELLTQQEEQRSTIINEIVNKLTATSSQLVLVAESLRENAKSSTEASSQLSISISTIAEGLKTNQSTVEKNVTIMSGMTADIQTVNDNAKIACEKANHSAGQADNGTIFISKLTNQMTAINESVDESFHTISSLHNRSEDIYQIIEVLSNISAQTNLLALNASIEAARAGEYGKGFSVVANEIRKLAEQSAISSQNIAILVQQTLDEANKSVAAMEKVKATTHSGLNVIQQSKEVFKEIFDTSTIVANQIQEITTLSEELRRSSEQVNQTTEEAAVITEQSVKSTQQVAATTDNQLEKTTETLHTIVKMRSLILELEDVINRLGE
ncbi:methyl-accepting chemotaxis protein [Metabacillus malikii]|uniref:Methyl-accepting chemotaxis protein n=1 Tax=Metabacillus malikii TaxID=1504265 RepID=A0ABT9ZD01_9BACI|nr:methyl-accepting chemotaxis protein [Metabacillus malikii]MDQ0229890.1 methyl-accepting chemotaxis protein [Metabacillus malikii]